MDFRVIGLSLGIAAAMLLFVDNLQTQRTITDLERKLEVCETVNRVREQHLINQPR